MGIIGIVHVGRTIGSANILSVLGLDELRIDYVELELVWTRLGCHNQVDCRSFEFKFRRA